MRAAAEGVPSTAQVTLGDPARSDITFARLAAGAAFTIAALLLTLPLRGVIPHTPLLFFFTAVALAAYFSGRAGAVLAIILSLVFAEWLVLPSIVGPVGLTHVVIRAVLFTSILGSIAFLTDHLHAARWRAEATAREAARLADDLREQTVQLELQVMESETLASELEEQNRQAEEQHQAVRRAAVRADRLQRFTASMLNHVGAASVSRVIVSEGRRAVEAAGALLAVAREDGTLDVIAAEGYTDEQLHMDNEAVRAVTPVSEVLRTGEPMWLGSREQMVTQFPTLHTVMDPQRQAWAVLPLEVDHGRIGALGLSFNEPGEFAGEDRSFMLLLAQQCAQALERARLHDMELRARVRAEFAERRLAFLSDASARLAASLDYLSTLANLAHVAVPEIADWCMVHLGEPDDAPRLIAVVHSDADQVALRRSLETRYPLGRNATTGYALVLRTGEPFFAETVTDADLRAAAQDDEHYRALVSLGLRSQLAVPITVEERVVGVLTLANSESGRKFGPNDLRLAMELGRRAGQAVENARLYQAAHHASEAKSDFLAVMSHELRTPLNAIIGYSDLLLLGVPDEVPERARRQVERIRGASTSLLQLVEEVLSFSRIEAGKEEVRISPVDVTTLVRDCVAMVEPLAAEKGLSLSLSVPDVPVKLVSDERKIRQILTNLLSNAVKFTERGGIEVSLTVLETEVRVQVVDTGIGIEPGHFDRIFDPFWQVEQSATRRFGGTGLGLGVARKLARLLEGRLEVHSEVGSGSTFALVLPTRMPGMAKLM